MHKNPERVAWTVLSVAFITFCLLAVSLPLGVRSYLVTSCRDQDTQLQRIEGIIQVRMAPANDPIAVTELAMLPPGARVIVGGTDRATLDFFERSHVTLYGNTDLELTRVESPRFEMSERPNQVELALTGGLIRVGVAPSSDRDTLFEILTPHTIIHLTEGSYRIEVTNPGTQITVLRGNAAVGPEAAPLNLVQGMRTRVDLGGAPEEPLPAAQNLVQNGDFQQPLSNGWITSTVVYTQAIEPPHIEVVEERGRQAVRLVRREPDDGNHTEVHLYQQMDHDVRDFDHLEISLDVMLNFQSLSGGGTLSSEFPVIVRLNFKDQWGKDQFWTHGFYYQNLANYTIFADPWGRPKGEQISRGVWYPYESGNLIDLLGDIRPMHITGLSIYASGWNYDSLVSEVQLIVE